MYISCRNRNTVHDPKKSERDTELSIENSTNINIKYGMIEMESISKSSSWMRYAKGSFVAGVRGRYQESYT